MNRITLFLFLLFISMGSSEAQYQKGENTSCSFFGIYGIESKNSSHLNSYLENNGYYSLGSLQYPSFWGIGIELTPLSSPLIGQVVFSVSNSNVIRRSMRSSLNSYGMSVVFLYNLCPKSKWIVAPLCGFGVNNTGLIAVSNHEKSSMTLEPTEEYLQLDFQPDFKLGAALYRNIFIFNYRFNVGAQFYYNCSFAGQYWHTSRGSRISDMPAIGIHGLGVQIKIGASIGRFVSSDSRSEL